MKKWFDNNLKCYERHNTDDLYSDGAKKCHDEYYSYLSGKLTS